MNKLLSIYYNEWKTSEVFKDLLLKEIYISANKDRPAMLSEIEVLKITLHGKAPELFRLEKVLTCDSDDVSNYIS